MKRFFLFTLLVALLVSQGCLIRWLRHPESSASLSSPIKVPLRQFEGILLVEAFIEEEGPYLFFVDTGAPICSLDPEVAEKIKKKRESILNVNVGGGTEGRTKAKLLRFDGLRLGGATFDNVVAVSLDLQPIEDAMGIKFAGILGLSLFAEFLLTIDYPNHQLIVEEGKLPAADQKEIFTYKLQQGHLTIPMTLGGKTLDIVLDTGSNTAIDLPDEMEKDFRFQSAPVVTGEALGATGKAVQRSARLDGDLVIGRYTFQTPIVSLLKTKEASVGGPLLKHFALTIDQQQETLRLSRSETTALTTPPVKSLGANLRKQKDGWEVIELLPGAPPGLAVGDVIWMVNGQLTTKLDSDQWTRMIESSEPLQLVLQRGDKKIPLTVQSTILVP